MSWEGREDRNKNDGKNDDKTQRFLMTSDLHLFICSNTIPFESRERNSIRLFIILREATSDFVVVQTWIVAVGVFLFLFFFPFLEAECTSTRNRPDHLTVIPILVIRHIYDY